MNDLIVGRFTKTTVCLLLGGAAFAAVTVASAQTASSTATKSDELEEIIVTANKIAEPVQKVAQTVNVVTAETIQDLHVQNIQELNNIVGGLSLTETSPSEQSISLRGIKMVNGTPTSNTVETYLNEVPISVVDAFSSTLDIGQVEVLKGPQGTLRGRPSPSGALTIATQKGSFTDYSGYAEVTGSDHDTRRAEAAFGGPISNTLAFRVAGLYDSNDGNGVHSIGNGLSDFQKTTIGRGTLDWAPSDRFGADLMVQYTRQHGDFYRQIQGRAPCAGDFSAPFDLTTSVGCGNTYTLEDRTALNTGANPNRYDGTVATLNAHFAVTSKLDLVYVGGINKNEYSTELNFDFPGTGASPGGAPIGPLSTTNWARTFSNELRLQSEGNEVYNYTYGVFKSNQLNENFFAIPPFTPANPATTTNGTGDLGLFTNQRFALGAKDAVQVGLRYSKTSFNTGRDYHSTTGNASYQHQFTEDFMAYVSYGTAFRPGSGDSQNPPQPFLPRILGNFGDEKSKSYEVGLKTQWFERRLTANLAVFDQKYDGYISQQFNVACTGVPNPNGLGLATNTGTLPDGTPTGPQFCFGTMRGNGNAESRGYELELHAKVADAWTIGAIYTYTDAHYTDALLPCNDYNGDGIVDTNGTAMVQQGQYVSYCKLNGPLGSLPKISFTANTSYDFVIGKLPAYVRANSFTRSSSYFPQTGTTFAGYTTVSGSIGLMGVDRKWDLSIWGKNLLNKVEQDTDGGPWNIGSNFSGLRIGTVTQEREIGATLRWNF